MKPSLTLGLVLALLSGRALAAERCFAPVDQTAGWKRVPIPDDAPALAAPAELEQFRANEPALISQQEDVTYSGGYDDSLGKTSYSFYLPKDARRLEVEFATPLRGAKVDVIAHSSCCAFPLMDEKRVAGGVVAVDWQVDGVYYVIVTVHRHFRPRPIVRRGLVVRQAVVTTEPELDASFRERGALYFRHPGGRRVVLCDAPGRALAVSRSSLRAVQAVPIALEPVR